MCVYIYIYIYMYIFVRMYVRACVRVRYVHGSTHFRSYERPRLIIPRSFCRSIILRRVEKAKRPSCHGKS